MSNNFMRIRRLSLAIACLVATAAHGAVNISKKPTQNMTCSDGVCTPTAKQAVLNVGELANMLEGGDVAVRSGSVAMDIEIDAALSWASANRLTLDSYRAIAFSQPVEVTGSGALTITTNDGGKNGDFSFAKKGRVEFWDTHSGLTINGENYTLVENIAALARELRHTSGTGLFLALSKSGKPGKRSYSEPPIDKDFGGTFEGLGNSVSHLSVSTEGGVAGLFYSIDFDGVVRDLHLTDVNISVLGEGFSSSLAGGNEGAILNCDASGQVSVNEPQSFAGGLIAENSGTITNSSAAVTVSGTGDGTVVGGLAGTNSFNGAASYGTIDQSYATGAVNGGDSAKAGGLVGENMGGRVYNSYAKGAVTGGGNSVVGGLIGSYSNPDEGLQPRLETSYSTGAVSGGSGATLGGSIGEDLSSHGIKSTYWDLDTSGISDPSRGAGNVQNDKGLTGLSTEQFNSGLPAGFDKKVWKEKLGINDGYPYLVDTPPTK